ncbi:hypothetical protein Glove_51g82 [Diversispora epigaea]|uniref:FAR-17a/AIG1-like protein n=1 Tax=Diversispora epigaea TaxID=1348612 RepID=A0A397JI16_9GLOM|nr:hypothetical protein Glove_51g82 [Diversispora epigaea]
MSNIFRILLHTSGIFSFSYSFYILPSLKRSQNLIFEFTHLTIIGLLFSLVAFVLALLYDIFTKSRVISILKNIFTAVSVPLEGLISLMYWSLILYDEKLILEPGNARLPFLIDLGFHLIPALCLWTDFLFFTKDFRKSHSHVFYILIFAFSYSIWIQFWFSQFGMWPYPLLAKLETQHRIGVYLACFVLCTGIYHLGAFVHTIFNKTMKKID